MTGPPREEPAAREAVEAALADLEGLVREQGRPNRYHARALLIPLGQLLLGEGAAAVAPELARARSLAGELGDPWREAALGELALAAAEHIHSADDRYLGLENYDFAYTFRARERLEARLLAAKELGLALPEQLQRGVEEADERLRPYLGGPPRA